jgi:cholesterol 7-dehydrogenase
MSRIVSTLTEQFRAVGERYRQVTGSALDDLSPQPPTHALSDDERLAAYPGPYPNGWYAVARSREVRGRPITARAFGERLALFRRASDGGAGVVAAACPHMGADLAQGRVVGDQLECPFHQWRFDGKGRCRHVPYHEGKLPRSLRGDAWPVVEKYGLLFAYHRAAGDPLEAPPYGIPDVAARDGSPLVHRGQHDAGVVRMHLVEFAENSADFRHFAPLHGKMLVPWTSLRVPLITVVHEATWEVDPVEPHTAWFKNKAHLQAFGREIPKSGADASIRFVGPGGVVIFTFDVQEIGRIVVIQTHTPVAPLALATRFTWLAERSVPRALVSYVVGNWISQWKEDVRIWERKVYQRRPMLLPGDGPVLELRKWWAQFYEPV